MSDSELGHELGQHVQVVFEGGNRSGRANEHRHEDRHAVYVDELGHQLGQHVQAVKGEIDGTTRVGNGDELRHELRHGVGVELRHQLGQHVQVEYDEIQTNMITTNKSLLSNYESNKINCFRGSLILLDDSILVKA